MLVAGDGYGAGKSLSYWDLYVNPMNEPLHSQTVQKRHQHLKIRFQAIGDKRDSEARQLRPEPLNHRVLSGKCAIYGVHLGLSTLDLGLCVDPLGLALAYILVRAA